MQVRLGKDFKKSCRGTQSYAGYAELRRVRRAVTLFQVFLRAKVVPAFLNRLLKQLQNVVSDGIDYSPTKEAMDAIQMDNCHLYRFAADSGLVYDPVLSVTATEIWENLRQWYIDNGIATVEHVYTKTESKEKLLWVPLRTLCVPSAYPA